MSTERPYTVFNFENINDTRELCILIYCYYLIVISTDTARYCWILGIMTGLSGSTLGFIYRSDLPKVSHSTALDFYIMLAVFVFILPHCL